MKKQEQYNELGSENNGFVKSLPQVELPYSRSKDEVWAQMQDVMDKDASEASDRDSATKVRSLRIVLRSAAAIIIVLLSTTAFMHFYTKTVNANVGQHVTTLLPDGSSIELNAGSVIKFKPFWWNFSREVQFEGEGFFKVQKGQSFEVVSSLGKTIVLGTSFNIYARKNEYKVTCYTGKVRVVSVLSGKSTDIKPNQQAIIKNGIVSRYDEVSLDETISWINDMFVFTATPIQHVFEEIERQYGIRIITSEKLDYLYTGNFTRKRSASEVVAMVCRSLGLRYEQINGGFAVSKR